MNPTEEGYIPLSRVRDYIELAGVYEIVCKPKARVYIGESEMCARRSHQHLSDLQAGRHSNRVMQYDFDSLNDPAAFYFKVIIPFDTVTDKTNLKSALRQAEKKEIDRRTKYGVMLYNNMSTREIGGERKPKEFRPEEPKEVVPVREQKPKQDYRDLPYNQWPGYNPPVLEGTCAECGRKGKHNEILFYCDDRQLRCPECVDDRVKNLQAFIKSERDRMIRDRTVGFRITSSRKMRWQMGANTAENDLVSAIAVYVRKYGQLPTEALVNQECILPGIEGTEVKIHQFTPVGYIDLPIPLGE